MWFSYGYSWSSVVDNGFGGPSSWRTFKIDQNTLLDHVMTNWNLYQDPDEVYFLSLILESFEMRWRVGTTKISPAELRLNQFAVMDLSGFED